MRAIPLVVAFLAGCASAPAQVEEPERPVGYTIPVIKANGTVDTFAVEPDGSTERMLFCIEGTATAMCISEDGGRVLKYFMPIPQLEPEA